MLLDTQGFLIGVNSAAAGLELYESRTIRRRMKRLVHRLSNLNPSHKNLPATESEGGLFAVVIKNLGSQVEQEEIAKRVRIIPATPEEIYWIAQFEAKHYNGDAIPFAVLNDWYKAFPIGFWIFRLPDGTRFGHLDLLPVKERTLEIFRKGTFFERQILSDALYSETERHKINSLYIESLAMDREYRGVGLRALLRELKSILNEICEVNRALSMYAIAASEDGLHFMKELGFTTITDRDVRIDHHPFLGMKAQDLMSNLETRFGNGTTLVFTRDHWNKAV